MLARASVALSIAICLAALASPALARRDATFNYAFARVWTAAVRLVRVELECPITEKDKDDGYFFFEYTNQNKAYPGTVELVSVQTEAGEQVRVIVQVPAMPSYVEAMILDRLGKKLEKEFGVGSAPKAPQPAEKPDPKPGAADEISATKAKRPVSN
jgi:hypothetical protein